MGTTYNVVVVDHDGEFEKAPLQSAIDTALAELNGKLSNWDSASEIARFNVAPRQASVTMSRELSHVMQAADHVHRASDGRFDTTIGPLIELWGFGAPGAKALPSPDAVARATEMSGHANTLALGSGTMAKRQSQAQVYLAGIGKGYGADYIGQVLETFGIKDYMVEIGGDLYAAGRNPDGLPWQIGIEAPNPADRGVMGVMGVVGVSGLGLATSGDYRNYFEVDGQRFSHLIDPKTGYPVMHKTASATVMAEDAMLADAWSTAMLILGREEGLEVASRNNIAVQFVEQSASAGQPAFRTYASQRFEALTT